MKITITRSFGHKRRGAEPYEMFDSVCAAQTEADGMENAVAASRELDRICREEVEGTLNSLKRNEIDHKKSEDVGRLDAVEDIDLPSGTLDL